MIPLVVLGAGGFGRETLDVVDAINRVASKSVFELLGVIDDDPRGVDLTRLKNRGVIYLGTSAEWPSGEHRTKFVVAIGNPQTRKAVAARFAALGLEPATLVHPNAVVGSKTTLGRGTIVCAGAILSTNIQVEDHVHINPGVIVGHDAIVSNFTSLNPGSIISGDVVIGEGTLVGAGATVLQGLQIGEGSVVGAMACVVRTVAAGSVVKGVPAR